VLVVYDVSVVILITGQVSAHKSSVQVPSSTSTSPGTAAADWQTEPGYEEHSGSCHCCSVRLAACLPNGCSIACWHVSFGKSSHVYNDNVHWDRFWHILSPRWLSGVMVRTLDSQFLVQFLAMTLRGYF